MSQAAHSSELLLLPGFDGTGELFAPFISALGSRLRSRTVRYGEERTFTHYVDAAASALPEAGAVLVAESFSGPIALAVAAKLPGRVHALVLCATFAVSPLRSLSRLAALIPDAALQSEALQRFVLNQFCLDRSAEAALRERALLCVRRLTPRMIRDRLAVLASVDMRASLASIGRPTIVLRAAGDKLVSSARIQALAAGVPGAVLREIPGPHLLLQTRPRECADAICAFLSEM